MQSILEVVFMGMICHKFYQLNIACKWLD